MGVKLALLFRNIVADDLSHRRLAVKLAIDIPAPATAKEAKPSSGRRSSTSSPAMARGDV